MPKKSKKEEFVNNFIGKQFSNWTVIAALGHGTDCKRIWECRCTCGSIGKVTTGNLVAGASRGCKSCTRKHGLTKLRKLSPDDEKELIKSYQAGISTTILGRLYNIHPATVINIAKRLNVYIRTLKDHGTALKKLPGETAFNQAYKRTKAIARYRDLTFSLTKEDYHYLTQLNCHYCNSPPSNKCQNAGGCYIYGGLDRIDSNQGYNLSNIVPACWICNRAKGTLSYSRFKQWINSLRNTYNADI